jgi:hypothetical protein
MVTFENNTKNKTQPTFGLIPVLHSIHTYLLSNTKVATGSFILRRHYR